MKIKSYCELLFGSREAYQKKVVAQLKKSRLKKRIDLVPVDKILEKEGLPLVREVERDPSKLTSRFFSLVSGSFGCTVNGVIGREIKKFLKSSQNFDAVLRDIEAAKFRASVPFGRQSLAVLRIAISCIEECEPAASS
ncbi:MAG: hypothetical protein A3B08_02225 [Candidatus Taylorbacteria bacterium RIFCSPLOWO2_01_FULL_43_44]|uniref:Uncharacterized protein n=1 Tax=Candidatus Taylorbacteria bacterium RIFCSPHIGHO2_02_FULL_43_32b TaxID=1802306 RepID=A0A1G2MII5_9BACT|nr:MAG: hypothetical protein A2743_01445 [Candidatus Taylorbacteria bacterium RIFCSPHIGHO2_01_FULL_43_47]OHA22979.1 MAG: hypothetical protein A3C72_02060 [Candidatus Taylorbacteria bacterium RIFCSPHIGHO2_02_FULL_43_32b]OHA29892.1 MAG: hypothetical protein A3B08_02225 [Candidatus Taylorbacteria bacterium RIFCSPLOWO2_01_FULL_43_44]